MIRRFRTHSHLSLCFDSNSGEYMFNPHHNTHGLVCAITICVASKSFPTFPFVYMRNPSHFHFIFNTYSGNYMWFNFHSENRNCLLNNMRCSLLWGGCAAIEVKSVKNIIICVKWLNWWSSLRNQTSVHPAKPHIVLPVKWSAAWLLCSWDLFHFYFVDCFYF